MNTENNEVGIGSMFWVKDFESPTSRRMVRFIAWKDQANNEIWARYSDGAEYDFNLSDLESI